MNKIFMQKEKITHQKIILKKSKPQLSVFYITKNEAEILGKSLRSIKEIADEIIVVDNGSTDNTIDIAQAAGARVYLKIDWEGYGKQKNFALTKCNGTWVLSLDADEILNNDLIQQIELLIKSQPEDIAYKIKRENYFLDKKIKHVYKGDWVLRLFKNGTLRFNENLVHETLVPIKDGTSFQNISKGHLIHYSYLDSKKTILKIANYAIGVAEGKIEKKKNISLIGLFLKPIWGFLHFYFFKGGCLEGKKGFLLAMNNAVYKYLSSYHLYLHSKK